ncbi:MAG TPA: DUF4337 family protein [Verrucomicrobiae bacterium]|jgi:hypothetical protein
MSGHGVPHHAEHPEHKRIGIFIAVIAVIMAVIGALAKQQANENILREVKASNGFAWYQAKRQRSYMNELEIKRADFELAGNPTDAQRKILEATKAKLAAKNAEYETEGKDILASADADKLAAATAAHKHHGFEFAEIAMHIAVVLGSLTLLTDQKLFFHLGVAASVVGVALAIFAAVHKPHAEGHSGEAKPAAATKPAH